MCYRDVGEHSNLIDFEFLRFPVEVSDPVSMDPEHHIIIEFTV